MNWIVVKWDCTITRPISVVARIYNEEKTCLDAESIWIWLHKGPDCHRIVNNNLRAFTAVWTDKMGKMPSFIRKNQILWESCKPRQRFCAKKPNSTFGMSGNGVRNCQNEEMKLLDGEVPKSGLEPEGKTTFFQRFVNTYRYKCSLLNWILLLFCSKGKPVDASWWCNAKHFTDRQVEKQNA